jgi:hypothetical protein
MTRPAIIEDALRIDEIHVEGWRAAYRDIIPESFLAGLSVEKRAAGWRYAIEKDPGSVVVIEIAGSILGWAAIGTSRDRVAGAGELFVLYIDPRAWRSGHWGELDRGSRRDSLGARLRAMRPVGAREE